MRLKQVKENENHCCTVILRGHNGEDLKRKINPKRWRIKRRKKTKPTVPFLHLRLSPGPLIVAVSASLCFLLLSFLHVFSGLCISSAKRLCNFSTVCDVLCLFPHLVSKERMCVFSLLDIIPTERTKTLVCRPNCQSYPTKLRIHDTFTYVSGPTWQQASLKPYLNVKLHRSPFVSSFWHAFLTFCVFLYRLLAFAYHLNNSKPDRSASSHFYQLRLKFVTLYIHVNVNVWHVTQCRTLWTTSKEKKAWLAY